MELSAFNPTKFGNWIVQLSYSRDHATFLLFATHIHNQDTIFRMFYSEMEVVNFVSFLGEKYE